MRWVRPILWDVPEQAQSEEAGRSEANVFPPFGPNGLLPPFTGQDPTADGARSPYVGTLVDVVDRFATTQERCRILAGLLRMRLELHNLGFVNGWQWLDGSYLENRPTEPRDIDIVTFLFPTTSTDPPSEVARRFREAGLLPPAAKARFSCDSYIVELLSGPVPAIRAAVYWYGLFSHRRLTFEWKGLVQVDLSPSEDRPAYGRLQQRMTELGS